MKLLPQMTDTALKECETSYVRFLYHADNVAKARFESYRSPIIVTVEPKPQSVSSFDNSSLKNAICKAIGVSNESQDIEAQEIAMKIEDKERLISECFEGFYARSHERCRTPENISKE